LFGEPATYHNKLAVPEPQKYLLTRLPELADGVPLNLGRSAAQQIRAKDSLQHQPPDAVPTQSTGGPVCGQDGVGATYRKYRANLAPSQLFQSMCSI